jgi:hypothetical protein
VKAKTTKTERTPKTSFVVFIFLPPHLDLLKTEPHKPPSRHKAPPGGCGVWAPSETLFSCPNPEFLLFFLSV